MDETGDAVRVERPQADAIDNEDRDF